MAMKLPKLQKFIKDRTSPYIDGGAKLPKMDLPPGIPAPSLPDLTEEHKKLLNTKFRAGNYSRK